MVELDQLAAHRHAQLGVQIGKRLVEQEDRRVPHDRAPQRDPLLLPARQRLWLARQLLRDAEDRRHVANAAVNLVAGDLLELEGEAHVVGDRHVRVEGVGLEHHGHVTVLGVDGGDIAIADEDAARGDRFQPGDHPQAGRLARARGADQDDELPAFDAEIDGIDGGHGAEALGQAFEPHRSHHRAPR